MKIDYRHMYRRRKTSKSETCLAGSNPIKVDWHQIENISAGKNTNEKKITMALLIKRQYLSAQHYYLHIYLDFQSMLNLKLKAHHNPRNWKFTSIISMSIQTEHSLMKFISALIILNRILIDYIYLSLPHAPIFCVKIIFDFPIVSV